MTHLFNTSTIESFGKKRKKLCTSQIAFDVKRSTHNGRIKIRLKTVQPVNR